MDRRVLGIDVGTAITGWSIVDYDLQARNRMKLIDYGAVITEAGEQMPDRLGQIYLGLLHIIGTYNPTETAVESLFYFKNQTTVMTVSQARGVILLAAQQSGLEIFEYTPLQVKSAVTGYGRAEKKQVQAMVKSIMGMKEIPKPDDAADAIAIAICHLNSSNSLLKKLKKDI